MTTRTICWMGILALNGAGLWFGCTADTGGQNYDGQGGTTSATGTVATTASGAGTLSGPGPGTGTFVGSGSGSNGSGSGTTSSGTGTDGCAAVSVGASKTPVDLYVMFDATLTMTCPEGSGTRWDAFVGAMTQFVGLPDAAGLGIGIQYFGLNDSCNPADYATPDVPIAPLPGNAQPIINSLNSHSAGGVTPLAPPLQGAIDYARAYTIANPGHAVAVLLVTDGQPNLCGAATVAEVVAAAAAGVNGMPVIGTYVIGIVVPMNSGCFWDTFDMGTANAIHEIAWAGGTGQAVVVQTGTNAAQQFLDAIKLIQKQTALPCSFAIPAPPGGGIIDFGKVNVTFTDGTGQTTDILSAGTLQQCAMNGGGWYYDNPMNPTAIKLCPETCAVVTADPAGKIDIVLGCETKGVPPPF